MMVIVNPSLEHPSPVHHPQIEDHLISAECCLGKNLVFQRLGGKEVHPLVTRE